jgi:hypothetical protein
VQPTGQVTDVGNLGIIYDVMVTMRFYRGGVLTASSGPIAWRSYSTDRAYACTILPRNSSISPIFTDSASHSSDNVDGEYQGSLMSTFAWQGVLSEAEIAETMTTSTPKHTSHQTTCMPLPLGANTGGVCTARVPCVKTGFQKRRGTTPGEICRDFDECSSNDTNNCHESASCTNIGGGFRCECNQGFVGNGTSCQSASDSSTAPFCGSLTTPGYICQCSNSVSTCQDNNEVNHSPNIWHVAPLAMARVKVLCCFSLVYTNSSQFRLDLCIRPNHVDFARTRGLSLWLCTLNRNTVADITSVQTSVASACSLSFYLAFSHRVHALKPLLAEPLRPFPVYFGCGVILVRYGSRIMQELNRILCLCMQFWMGDHF